MERVATAWAIFQGLLLEAIPFLLLGVVIAGLARWLVPQGAWISRLPRHPVLAPVTGTLPHSQAGRANPISAPVIGASTG